MAKEKIETAQMDGICKAGCILSIISSGIAILVFLVSGIILMSLNPHNNITPDELENFRKVNKTVDWILIILGFIQILPLYFTINLLRGKASSNIPAGIIALLFSNLIGGILILVGKYQVGSVNDNPSSQENQENNSQT